MRISMSLEFLALVVLACPFPGVAAQPSKHLKVACAFPTQTPPRIDGQLDEPCWSAAEWNDGFLRYNEQERLTELSTAFAVLYDAEYLYVGFRCAGAATPPAPATPHDQWPGGDVMELFLDPGLSRSEYYQFAANIAGSRYESFMEDKQWDCEWLARARRDAHQWSLEARIPLRALSPNLLRAGDGWGINLTRDSREISTWARVGAAFHSPGNFGTLVFGRYGDYWNDGFRARWREMEKQIGGSTRDAALLNQLRCATGQAEKLEADVDRRGAVKTRDDFEAVYPRTRAILTAFQNIQEELAWVKVGQSVHSK